MRSEPRSTRLLEHQVGYLQNGCVCEPELLQQNSVVFQSLLPVSLVTWCFPDPIKERDIAASALSLTRKEPVEPMNVAVHVVPPQTMLFFFYRFLPIL